MMERLVAEIIALAGQHREAAYMLACLFAAGEAVPILGAALPGEAVILGLAALVPTGALGFWPLVVATTIGAIIGDGVSYWLGHHYHREIAGFWPLSRHPEVIHRGEAMFARHGGKSVFIARFMPGVRAVVPLIAGIVGMPVARFYVMNALSAIAWGASHIVVGALAGAVLVLLGAIAGRLAILAVALLAAGLALGWLTRRVVGSLPDLAVRLQARLGRWAASRRGFLPRLVISLVDPRHEAFGALAMLAVLLVGSLWLFLGILQDLASGDPLTHANLAVANLMLSLRNELADRLAVPLARLADPGVTAAVALAALAWLATRRTWWAIVCWLAAFAAAGAATLMLQALLRHPAPAAGVPPFAFPSGAITESAVLFGFLVLLAGRELAPRWRMIVATVAVLLVTAVAFARLYLGTGWLSDLAGGLSFGPAWVALAGIAYLRHRPGPVRAVPLVAMAGAALMVAGAVQIGLRGPAELVRYNGIPSGRSMPLTAWQGGGWATLPGRRVDLTGGAKAPFTVQWAGSRQALAAGLGPYGWHPPPPWTPSSALAWLLPHPALGDLPVLPHLSNGRAEGLILVNLAARPGERLVLRLWRADVTLNSAAGRAVPLWIGTAGAERAAGFASLMTIVRTLPDRNGPRNMLAAAIAGSRLERRPGTPGTPYWDGAILLAREPEVAGPTP